MNATLVAEVPAPTLADVDLFAKIISAVRTLEQDGEVRQVITSPAHGIIVVIDNNYDHVAMRVVQ